MTSRLGLTDNQSWVVSQSDSGTADRGGSKGIPVRWVFEGVSELLPVYEKIEDGAEIMWAQHSPRMLRTLRRLVKPKGAFKQ